MRAASLLFSALALAPALTAGCAPPTLLLAADSARGGALGDDGAFGALLLQRDVRVRGDRNVLVDVVVPADDDGAAATGPFPPVLLVQGGLAAVARYHWLAQHIASRGFVVVAPHHDFDLAFFAQGNGPDALAAVRRSDDVPIDDGAAALAVGHSLGGVVAATAWADDEGGFSRLALLSSVPDPAADLSRRSGRVLSIAGGRDGKISTDEVAAGAAAFNADVTFAIVDDATHYDFTDDASDDEVAADGDSVDVAAARRDAQVLLDALLAGHAGDVDGDLFLDDPRRWPAGVQP